MLTFHGLVQLISRDIVTTNKGYAIHKWLCGCPMKPGHYVPFTGNPFRLYMIDMSATIAGPDLKPGLIVEVTGEAYGQNYPKHKMNGVAHNLRAKEIKVTQMSSPIYIDIAEHLANVSFCHIGYDREIR